MKESGNPPLDSGLENLEIVVPGKWILAGEHSVLRGAPALVFPLIQRSLRLQYRRGSQALQLDLGGEYGPEFRVLFWSLMDRACELAKISRSHLRGSVHLASQIPVGSGLGASAALCVSVGLWFEKLGWVKNTDVYEFSRNLENLFHGESSGVDVAVALLKEPIRFLRNGDRQKVQIKWRPSMYLSYSGSKGSTLDCVQRVKAFIEKDPILGEQLDRKMIQAVELAEQALSMEAPEGRPRLVEAIQLAKQSFDEWGLTPHSEIEKWRGRGALAAKPTGSGGGGFILTLWENEPPEEYRSELISCF